MSELTSTRRDPGQAAVVFYDGGCPVCRTEIATYRRFPGAETVEWCDATTAPLPDGLDRDEAIARFHVLRADGAMVSGFRAFLAVWRINRLLRWPAAVLDRAPFTWIGEGAYRLFLMVRPMWRRR